MPADCEPSSRPAIVIRPDGPDENATLSALALRSKASVSYSDEFIGACREELTLMPAKMAVWQVWVAEAGAALVGMVALNVGDGADSPGELEELFVEPSLQSHGIGGAVISTLVCKFRATMAPDVAFSRPI